MVQGYATLTNIGLKLLKRAGVAVISLDWTTRQCQSSGVGAADPVGIGVPRYLQHLRAYFRAFLSSAGGLSNH